jgi:hypothetical protein
MLVVADAEDPVVVGGLGVDVVPGVDAEDDAEEPDVISLTTDSTSVGIVGVVAVVAAAVVPVVPTV